MQPRLEFQGDATVLECAGTLATAEELAIIAAARVALTADAWVSSRTDSELLRFVRSSRSGDLVERLRSTSAWRQQTVPAPSDTQWDFQPFFALRERHFFLRSGPSDGDFMEWLTDGDQPLLDEDGAAVLLVRPRRHKPGEISPETWLRLVTWHAERVGLWGRDQGCRAAERNAVGSGLLVARGSVTVLIDWRDAGVRNMDLAVLRRLLPKLARNYPNSLHRAYVAPVNSLFTAVWQLMRLLLPKRATDRFTLVSGGDWREQLAEALGQRVARRLPFEMQPDLGAGNQDEGISETEITVEEPSVHRLENDSGRPHDLETMVAMIGND
jgi:hypothetical protein